jgi:DNA-directed RNA polymerase subunit RPC12/RpoP
MRKCSSCKKEVPESEYWNFPYNVCIQCIRKNPREALKNHTVSKKQRIIKIINCLECSKKVVVYANSGKRCPNCALKKKREQQRNYQRRKRLTKKQDENNL